MKKYFKVNSIAFQLVIFILIISIIPVSIVTYNTSISIGNMKQDQFDERLDNIAVIGDQAYKSRLERDNTLASIMANDYGLQTALITKDKLTTKRIIDRYSRAYPDISIVVVTNESGTQIATSSSSNVGEKISNDFIDSALTGKGMSGVDIVPSAIIKENFLEYKTMVSGTTDGLGIYSSQPIKDEGNILIGAIIVIDLLNDNTELVDRIASDSHGVCSIFMGNVRIATTLRDERDIRLQGNKADPALISEAMESSTNFKSYEDLNGQHIYTVFEPLRNPKGEIVGIIAVGYDINPFIAETQNITIISIATGLLIAMLSATLGFVFIKRITTPIHRLVESANSVASGNLNTPLDFGRESDEITELLSSIRKMVDSIKDRINYNESILKSISDPMLVLDNNDRVILFNEPASRLTGYSPGDAMGRKYTEILGDSPENGAFIRDIVSKHKLARGFEDSLLLKDDKKLILMCSCAPIKDASGHIIGTILLLRNITRKKETENQIQASLKEKELLLKEIHHRVKNNLQVISSLLNLQSAYIEDKHATDMFKESQNRVRSMALIHERLYQSKDFTSVDFGEYLRKLADSLAYSYGPIGRSTKVTIDSDNISLGIDTAVPCGLIINELLTNSFKYAFADGRHGEIQIGFNCENTENCRYRLTVKDNGVGIHPDIDIENTTTLGLQLVVTLTDQINGTMTVNREKGTEFIIVFSGAKVHSMRTAEDL